MTLRGRQYGPGTGLINGGGGVTNSVIFRGKYISHKGKLQRGGGPKRNEFNIIGEGGLVCPVGLKPKNFKDTATQNWGGGKEKNVWGNQCGERSCCKE